MNWVMKEPDTEGFVYHFLEFVNGGGVGEEGRDGGGGEATETAAIPVVEVSESNRISREREMRERLRCRVTTRGP